jgi:hypothetical protein
VDLAPQYGLAGVQHAPEQRFQFVGQIRQYLSKSAAKMPGNAYSIDLGETFIRAHEPEVAVHDTKTDRYVCVYAFQLGKLSPALGLYLP